ncbi:lebercilin isoform X2 [Pungitius pungitius]|uniref:lebercilin isoform X2 n=1 Tax=Pungitius pungitius TaxID=134920 RepID=UPI002E163AB2
MESENVTDLYEDNRDVDQSRQSLRSTKKDSRASSLQNHKQILKDKVQGEEEKDVCVESRSKTRTWRSDPDRDRLSDGVGRRSTGSLYSEDYENESPSGRSISPYSQSRSPSLTPQRGVRAKRISNGPFYKTGVVGRRGVTRPPRPGGQPLTQQHRKGVRSGSKESVPPKDLDLVTKRMLSARLLKINEMRNSLAELQQRTDELQKENRVLRQLQVRQEKALQRYDDTESEISQLLVRHTNETHVLRERLRRTQERERAAERRMRDSEEQLQRSQATIARLKKLVDQRDLGARDDLSRRLDEEKTRAQEAERKIKELERSMELSSNSYQRQMAAERKKTISAQEEIRTLQEELERLTNKLKEKERELDTKNIYANRMMKPPLRRDVDSGAKRIVPSRSSTKAAQTKDATSSLDFPSPPPAIADANECSEQAPDGYLSLKIDGEDGRTETEERRQKLEQQRTRVRAKGGDKETGKNEEEKRQLNQELTVLDEKAETARDDSLSAVWERKTKRDESKRTPESSLLNQEDENDRKRGHVQEEVDRWNQGAAPNQQAAQEARRKKEQLLAKLREIDRQEHRAQDTMFAEPDAFESNKAPADHSSPRLPEHRNHNSTNFNITESEESAGLRAGSGEGGRRRSGPLVGAVTSGTRAPRSQISGDDLAFGSYAPSFGHSASRGSSGFPPPPPKEDRDSALEAIGVFSLRGLETEKEKETERGEGKERKSNLMQQLFGALAAPASDSASTFNKMEVLNSPPSTNGVRPRREGLLRFNSGSSTPPASSMNTLHITDSRPAVRAIASFDDDIEELTL